jgi:hypothetical protein
MRARCIVPRELGSPSSQLLHATKRVLPKAYIILNTVPQGRDNVVDQGCGYDDHDARRQDQAGLTGRAVPGARRLSPMRGDNIDPIDSW